MDLSEWMSTYEEIKKTLPELSFGLDREARDIAVGISKNSGLSFLEKKILGKICWICGPGKHPEAFFDRNEKDCVVCADSAISTLFDEKVLPDIVVTDLDGDVEKILYAEKKGAVVVVHAHGDNIAALKKHLARFEKPVITTQVEPVDGVYNFFGFADGDRACFLAKRFGAKKLFLVGFDFSRKKKYRIAEELIKKLSKEIETVVL